MKNRYKINGIRLNKNLIQITPKASGSPDQSTVPFYRTLSANRINMVFMVLNTVENHMVTSGTISSKDFNCALLKNDIWEDPLDVCMMSIYPHHYQLNMLGHLMSLLGQKKLSFRYLVSSNAMLTFVVEKHHHLALQDMLSDHFDLPDSHAPFDQEDNQELTEFLKRKYPETRATYVEDRIKTYGISLAERLVLDTYCFSFNEMGQFGQMIESMNDQNIRFSHVSAHMDNTGQIHVFLLTKEGAKLSSSSHHSVELLSFQGPHFGDRHSIVSRALNCFSKASIPVVIAGCTGASINIVVPEGIGSLARQALFDAFETPE